MSNGWDSLLSRLAEDYNHDLRYQEGVADRVEGLGWGKRLALAIEGLSLHVNPGWDSSLRYYLDKVAPRRSFGISWDEVSISRRRVLEVASLTKLAYEAHRGDQDQVRQSLASKTLPLGRAYSSVDFLGPHRDCSGFIATADDEVIVILRGTATVLDWLFNLAVDRPTPESPHPGYGAVADFWADDISDAVRPAAKAGKRVIVAGHSLGGGVAELVVRRLVADGVAEIEENPPDLITFGAPRIGVSSRAYAANALRFRTTGDLIPDFPFGQLGYTLAGPQIMVDPFAGLTRVERVVDAMLVNWGAMMVDAGRRIEELFARGKLAGSLKRRAEEFIELLESLHWRQLVDGLRLLNGFATFVLPFLTEDALREDGPYPAQETTNIRGMVANALSQAAMEAVDLGLRDEIDAEVQARYDRFGPLFVYCLLIGIRHHSMDTYFTRLAASAGTT